MIYYKKLTQKYLVNIFFSQKNLFLEETVFSLN